MKPTHASLAIGDIACTILSDGEAIYPVEFIFPDLSPAERADKAGASDAEIAVPYACLLLDAGDRRILIDTGLGEGVQPTAGHLHSSLEAAGIDRNSIDTIVLSHGHPDHIGGLTNDQGERLFPQASYIMTEADWRFWTADDLEAQLGLPEPILGMLVGSARKNLPAIAEHVELVPYGHEVADGVSIVSAPGHTPGHAAIEIASGPDSLLAVGDAIVLPVQLRYPEWCILPDDDRELTIDTRRSLLDRAAADRSLVLPYHFPFPCLGWISVDGSGWAWEPADPASIGS